MVDQRAFLRILFLVRFSFAITTGFVGAWAQTRVLTVHDVAITNPISRFMTGACLEDVNHEVYGGIYSQMIFGESFQESAMAKIKGFLVYGGSWNVVNGELSVVGANGPKMVLDNSSCADCEAGVEVNLGSDAGPSGLILRVSQPGIGADNFHGYEISLGLNLVRFGKHENDFTLLRERPYKVPTGQWVGLKVKVTGSTLSVFVNGDSVESFTDTGLDRVGASLSASPALATGFIGLRAWSGGITAFRNMWVNTDGTVRNIPFTPDGGGISGMWQAIRKETAVGSFGLDLESPFKGSQSQSITFVRGSGEVGVENQGLNSQGMAFVGNRPYEGYLWVRAPLAVEIYVALESADGSTVFAETKLSAGNGNQGWERLSFILTPTATVFPGRFAIKLKQAGTVSVGHAFLQPGEWGRYQGLPVRRDIAEGLVSQKLTVLRYGGTMINDNGYRWKNMIGPRDQRPMTHGHWYPYSSNGWGIFDFLDFCEKAGILGIPALNSFETAADLSDFIEYANGAISTTWGAKRASDGHPASYGLKYLEIGNEEMVNAEYYQRFQSIAPAIWSKDPDLILVVGDFGYDNVITDPYHFTGSWSGITSLSAQKQILDLAKSKDREVWFDIHINTDAPPDPKNIPAILSFSNQLGIISPGAKYKLVCFELNTFSSHSLARALANADAINALERIGDRLAMVCSANCLQMASANYLPSCLAATLSENPGGLFNVTASKSLEGNEISIKFVNGSSQAATFKLSFDRFLPVGSPFSITTLTGAPNAVNTAENPLVVKPASETLTSSANQEFKFPANSFTVIHYAPATVDVKAGSHREPRARIVTPGRVVSLLGRKVSAIDAKGSTVDFNPPK
jgi:hypothetical protein